MKTDKHTIQEIANLARIPLDGEAAEALSFDFASIIAFMEDVKKLPVDNVPETARVTEGENVWREDIVEPSLLQSEALLNGTSRDGYFEVPKILSWDK